MNAVDSGHTGCLLFIMDDISGQDFLCDTGVQVSVLPATPFDARSELKSPLLKAANSSKIPTYGKQRVVF